MREHPRAAIDDFRARECHSAASAMQQQQPSLYVSELSRRGLARRRARIRRRSLVGRRMILLVLPASALVVALIERVSA
jgi:hypothetical protein